PWCGPGAGGRAVPARTGRRPRARQRDHLRITTGDGLRVTPVAPAGTGPGPMPGTDPRESARVVMGECHALPFLPELPERGPGADQIGRTLALLADLPVDVSPRGWRLADSPGRLARR